MLRFLLNLSLFFGLTSCGPFSSFLPKESSFFTRASPPGVFDPLEGVWKSSCEKSLEKLSSERVVLTFGKGKFFEEKIFFKDDFCKKELSIEESEFSYAMRKKGEFSFGHKSCFFEVFEEGDFLRLKKCGENQVFTKEKDFQCEKEGKDFASPVPCEEL